MTMTAGRPALTVVPDPPPGPVTDLDLIRAHCRQMVALGAWSPATTRVRASQLRRWRDWLGSSGRTLATARRCDVIEWLGTAQCAETRHSMRAAVAGLHDWLAHEQEWPSPVWGLPRVRRPVPPPRPLPDELLWPVLATCQPETARMVVLGRWAGLRAGEIARVHGDDLEPDGSGGWWLRVHGKGAVERVVPAHPLVVAAVQAAGHGWLVPGRQPGSHAGADLVIRRISEALPDGWTAHSLRHAFASRVHEASGWDLLLVQRLLGHTSPMTTQRYVALPSGRARDVVTGLAAAA